MPRKKRTTLTPELKKRILSYMAEGHSIESMCRLDPALPTPHSIRDHQIKDKEFNDAVTRGYEARLLGYADEIDYLSTTPLHTLYPDLDFKEAAEAAKRRISALQQLLRDFAPTISARYSKVTKVEHSGEITDTRPVINIISYARDPNALLNNMKNITPIDIIEDNNNN